MRKIEYLSPTSIALYEKSPEDFYLRYLAESRPPKEPQTKAMAVGSAFDAYIKSHLHQNIFGKGFDPKFEFQAIFEAQVEPQNRTEAKVAGEWCFEWYRRLGAIADLMQELNQAIGKPRFEIDLKGTLSGFREPTTGVVVNIPFNGKPDCFFITKEGAHVILDWKVNGYYSNHPPSPKPGYFKLRTDGKSWEMHKNSKLEQFKGMIVNTSAKLEELDEDWARQLTIYACQTGEEPGSEFIARIEQLVCNAGKLVAGCPAVRVASHSCFVGVDFQKKVFEKAAELWSTIKSEQFHFFKQHSLEDSRSRCALLDKRAKAIYGDSNDPLDQWFKEVCR